MSTTEEPPDRGKFLSNLYPRKNGNYNDVICLPLLLENLSGNLILFLDRST